MEVLAIVPARGGSKRLPRKNLLLLNGKPLVVHTIEHALRASCVQKTVVSTEDPEIAGIAEQFGAQVVHRPLELASDTATSESALLHVLDTLEAQERYIPEMVVFLQCTSPIRAPGDIDNAMGTLLQEGADSLFSAVRSHRFVWSRQDRDVFPINYDPTRRPREQHMQEQFQENGSIYIFKPWVLRKLNNRLGGKIVLYEMDYWSSVQVDCPEDWELCCWAYERHREANCALALPRPTRAVFFDFDGVFTDNRVLFHQDGTEAVLCDRADSLGIAMLKEKGIAVAVLSMEKNPVVAARCAKMDIPCYQGIGNKAEVLRRLLQELNIGPQHAVFVGNDVNDRDCIRNVGCGVAVADAHPTVLSAARMVLGHPGGKGAVRELCDLILASVGR